MIPTNLRWEYCPNREFKIRVSKRFGSAAAQARAHPEAGAVLMIRADRKAIHAPAAGARVAHDGVPLTQRYRARFGVGGDVLGVFPQGRQN